MQLTASQQEAFEKFFNLKVGALFMKQGTGKTRVALELKNQQTVILFCFYVRFQRKRI